MLTAMFIISLLGFMMLAAAWEYRPVSWIRYPALVFYPALLVGMVFMTGGVELFLDVLPVMLAAAIVVLVAMAFAMEWKKTHENGNLHGTYRFT